MVRLSPKGNARRTQRLQEFGLDNFGGGWNAVDEDLTMSMKYQTELVNFHRLPSGSQEKRFGTGYFVDVSSAVSGNIVDGCYFGTRSIYVTSDGEVATVKEDGTVEAVWNSTLAAALPGAPSGWTPGVLQVDFVPFQDSVVIHNGVDKPIRVDGGDYAVTYLQDLATGSNVNVPIGKYGCTVADYHVVAGIPSSPTEIYVSSKGTAGVFPGDPIPNDSISINVGAYAPEGGGEIIGVAGFRSQLLVFFDMHTLVIGLGEYNADEQHEPTFPDTLPHYGLISHRCIVPVQGDVIFSDTDGVNSAKRNLFSGLLEPSELSALIAPAYRASMGTISTENQRRQCFAVFDPLHNEVMTFDPNGNVFIYSFNDKLKYSSWSKYEGWTWESGHASTRGRVFFTRGTKVYQLGNTEYGEAYYGDEVGAFEYEYAAGLNVIVGDRVRDPDGSIWKALVAHTTGNAVFADERASNENNWEEYEGIPIDFAMELPWLYGQDRMKTKVIRFLSWLTKGTAHFTTELYVDNLYKDADGVVIHNSDVSLVMVGNDYRGAGFNVNAGGGRKSGSPKLYKFPAKFKGGKFRITGSSTKPLTIAGLVFLYAKGSFKR